MANTTLLLDPVTWDLTVDLNGNIAVASDGYALAQDAASAIRLFRAELWYDTTQGIPYFEKVLGQMPPLALLKAYFQAAALTVPGVASAKVFITSIGVNRIVTGQVQITNTQGQTSAATFSTQIPTGA